MIDSTRPRLLIIGLDGLELSYAQTLMDSGDMPALAALRDRSARFLLEHGPAQRTGLAWEHVASGLSPEDAQRWSAVEFDSATYRVWQEGARFVPFLERLEGKVVVFDNPYIDLRKTSRLQGIVGWGAHDPGTTLQARPSHLLTEFQAKFGAYPAPEWIYACPSYSAERSQQMGAALVKALQVRQDATLWLMNERFADADVFFMVTGELHSGIEGLWHGVDPTHPMHGHPSAPAAAEALRQIHRAVDRYIAAVMAAVGDDCPVIAFATGGMGANQSDLQSMVLLPELLHRHQFGQPLLTVPQSWQAHPEQIPTLSPDESWGSLRQYYPQKLHPPLTPKDWVAKLAKKILPQGQAPASSPRNQRHHLGWHPAMFYQAWWPKMRAFALPSFYDGRIRINLKGREMQGMVGLSEYEAICTDLMRLLRACRDPRTGEPVILEVERPRIAHPFDLDSSDADILFVWNGSSNAFEHPDYGLIGPIPYRRTGGHTNPHGVAYFARTPLPLGSHGVRSSFDVVPTILELVNGTHPSSAPLSGESLLAQFAVLR